MPSSLFWSNAIELKAVTAINKNLFKKLLCPGILPFIFDLYNQHIKIALLLVFINM